MELPNIRAGNADDRRGAARHHMEPKLKTQQYTCAFLY